MSVCFPPHLSGGEREHESSTLCHRNKSIAVLFGLRVFVQMGISVDT